MRIATYALAEAPVVAVKRHLELGEPPPPVVDALVEATYLAAITVAGART